MNCPICKKVIEALKSAKDATTKQDKSYYPFCSERCQLIDLGRWLGGKYQIPVAQDSSHETD